MLNSLKTKLVPKSEEDLGDGDEGGVTEGRKTYEDDAEGEDASVAKLKVNQKLKKKLLDIFWYCQCNLSYMYHIMYLASS